VLFGEWDSVNVLKAIALQHASQLIDPIVQHLPKLG
jgi:hypothetical protein